MTLEVRLTGSTIPKTVSEESILKMDDLYAYYHRQMYYYKTMFGRFKNMNSGFNAIAIILVSLGMIVGSVWPDSFAMLGLTAMSATVKGWVDFKGYAKKMEMCRFAYTTFEKILLELSLYARGLPLEDMETFLRESKVSEEIIKDLAPPVDVGMGAKYEKMFIYRRVSIKVVQGEV